MTRAAYAYPVVFCAGFVFLLLEITSGRLLAPAVGFSLETWTGIIGVVLAGQAIGDTLGGRLIDRLPSPRLLAATLVLGGVAVLSMPALSVAARGLWPTAPLMLRVMGASAIVLLAPSMLMAAVSPMATRLVLRHLEGTGRTVGALSAVSTTGSVLGVVLGGFVLLERFGVRAIVFSSGFALLLLGALTALSRTPRGARPEVYTLLEPESATARFHWSLYALPFVSGAAIMAVELGGARLAAMVFGTSLYTWASTIGMVLLGIAVGTAVGGWLADRHPSRTLLSLILLASAVGTLSVLVAIFAYARLWPAAVERMLATIRPGISLPLMFGGILLPASVSFGAITPITIRLLVRRVSGSGTVVGRAYAAQAAGSIAGTFVTGFLLISHLGARAVIVLIAAGALAVAALVANPARPRVRLALRSAGAVVLLSALFLAYRRQIPSPCLRESNYYCIRVRHESADVRRLTLDNLVHTYINLKNPTALVYEYEQVFAMLAAERAASRGGAPHVLLVGGGGYAFPRYVQQVYPTGSMSVVEIDPAVTETAYENLALPRNTPIRTWNEDGRQFFLRDRQARYDLILGDAFRDAYSAPFHLTTTEFAGMVAGALEPGGIYAVNIIDGPSVQFLRSTVRTLQQVFPHVYVLPIARKWREYPQIMSVVVASARPVDVARVVTRRPPGVPENTQIFALTDSELAAFLDSGESMVLTDDRAPVENLLARVYAQSVRRAAK